MKYGSGGRGVAGSNPVIPTTDNQRLTDIIHKSFFLWFKHFN